MDLPKPSEIMASIGSPVHVHDRADARRSDTAGVAASQVTAVAGPNSEASQPTNFLQVCCADALTWDK